MLLFTPVIILLTAYLLIQALHWIKSRLRWDWIICMIALVGVWLFLVAIPVDLYKPVVVSSWVPGSGNGFNLLFEMTKLNWMVTVILTAFYSTYIIVSVISEKQEHGLISWHNSLLILSASFFIILSSDIILIGLGLTLFDLAELVLTISVNRKEKVFSGLEFRAFSWKALSTFILLGISLERTTVAQDSSALVYPQKILILLLFAFLIRFLFSRSNCLDESQIGNTTFHWRLLQPSILIIMMVTLSKISITDLSQSLKTIISFGLLTLGLISSFRNLKLPGSSLFVRNLGAIFLCGIALGVIHGLNWAGNYWIPSFIFLQASIVLSRDNKKGLNWLPLLMVAFAIGFPFSPFSPMWEVLIPSGWLFVALFLMAIGATISLLVQNLFIKKQVSLQSTRGIQFIYIVVMLLFMSGQWLILGNASQVQIDQRHWWIGTICLSTSVLFFTLGRILARRGDTLFSAKVKRFDQAVTDKIGQSWLSNWMRAVPRKVDSIFQSSINFLTVILEKESGLLWSVLILMLLISLVGSGVIK